MFSDLLQAHAARDGARVALTFLGDGDAPSAVLDYRTLDLRATAIAAALQARVPRGSRVLLVFPNDHHYVTAFFGCLYAGMIAVPVYPPASSRRQHLQRLFGIVRDATPSVVLTLTSLAPVVRAALAELSVAAATSVAVVATDADDAEPGLFRPVAHATDDLALLQYTSGSTSTPKGVMVSHGNLIANSTAIRAAFGFVADDVIVSWLPLFHDMGLIGGMLQSIFSKLPLVLFSPEHFGGSPVRWLRAVSRFGGTVSGGPDFAYRMCVERVTPAQLEGVELSSWRVAFSGSEPIRAGTLTAFADRFAPAGFSAKAQYGCYGLAEATLFVSGPARGAGTTIARFDARALASDQARVAEAGRALVGCGAARPDHDVAVVDPSSGAAVAAGQVGEIFVRGPSVTAGYWRNPEATREAWVERAGGVYLRTGDLGFLHGGELFVTGRRKDLMIVRGHNLYPQDIEQTIADEIDVIRKGRIAAFAVDGDDGERLGVAAELSHSAKKLVAPELLGRLMSEAVAEVHGEPLALILLLEPGTLPLTTSGKLRRGACLAAWRDQSLVPFAVIEGGALRGAPSTAPALDETSARLVALWREVLGVPSVGLDDTFFALGGSSLSSMQLVGRIADELGVTLEVRDVLGAPSLRAMARVVDRATAAVPSSPTAAIAAVPRTAQLALSPGEQRLWFLHQVDPDSTAYTLIGSLRITGALDRAALAQAFDQLVARHEILRTRFGARDGRPRRVIDAPWQVALPVTDLRARPRDGIDDDVRRVVVALARQPFALDADRLLRVALVALADTEHVLIVACHHIVADGWSMDLLRDELIARYAALRAGAPAALAAQSIQIADHAAWHQAWLASAACARQLAYWQDALAGTPTPLVLPPAREAGGRRDGQHAIRIDAALAAELRALADRHDATLFMVLLGALHVVLQRWGGHDDLWVGTPIANRAARETRGLVGFLVNTAVLRTRVDAREGFAAHLARVKHVVAGALANAEVPFQKVVERVVSQHGLERGVEQQALFQVMYNHLRPAYATPVARAGLTLHEAERAGHAADFDLVLDTVEDAAGISAVWSYRADRLAGDAIARLAAEYAGVLAAVVRAPDAPLHRLPRLAAPPSRGAPAHVGPSVAEAFARCAAATPTAIAVRCADATLDYATLDARASRWASHLRQLGVGPDVLVGLCAEPSLELVVGMLAVIKAGAAYLPLEPSDPSARLGFLLRDARPRVVLVQPHLAHLVAGFTGTVWSFADEATLAPATPFTTAVHAEHLAYCIYTSGSSGVPKGTLLRHGGLTNHLAWMLRTLGRPAADRVLQCASAGFDASVCELWLPLITGGTCVLASRETARDPDALIAQLGRDDVTMMQAVPSLLALLLDASGGPAALARLRCLISGGEALPAALRDRLVALPNVVVFNLYGPTEVTIDATGARLAATDRGAVAIGGPIDGATAYALDRWGQPAPVGGVGELHVGGAGLARGYLGRPDLTAERFVPDPFAAPGARMYRTGDLVRQRPDGALEYLDRADAQIKLHGHRIELGEISARLTEQPELRQAVVVVREDAPGKPQLVAYVAGPALDEAALRIALPDRLARVLPAYMVPRIYVCLDHLPTTPSGKLDRAALPAPDLRAAQALYTAPRSDGERALAAIWTEVLGVAQIGVDDNFFLLGGDSITAIQVVSKARGAGLAMTAGDVFQHPTIAGLARAATGVAVGVVTMARGASLARLDPAVRAALPVPLAAIEDVLAVTAMQEGMLLHTLLEPGSGIYLMQDRYRIDRALDAPAFVAAWEHVIARHSALRASFWQNGGETLQIIHKQVTGAVAYLDLRGVPDDVQARQIDALLADERRRGFDLTQAPLLRLRLVQLADDRYCYVESHHHILMDDWCRSLLFRDFFAACEALQAGAPVALGEAPQYREMIAWLGRQDRDQARAHWSAMLAGIEEATPLAIDRRLAADAGPSRVADQALELSELDTARIAATARGLRLTVNTLAQGAWAIVLAQYAGTRDVVFGVTVAGRPPEVAGVQDMVGLFVNTIPLRVRIPDHGAKLTVADWLTALQADNVANRRYEHTPLVEIGACTALPRGEELFHSLFVFENAPLDPAVRGRAGELALELLGNRTHTNYPITVVVIPSAGAGLKLVLSYDERRFAAADITAMLEQLARVLLAIAARTDAPVHALSALTGDDAARLVRLWNATERPHDWACGYAERFEQRVAQHGTRVAARDHRAEISYAGLNAHANQIAHALVGRGVAPGDVVGVYAERGLGLLAALIGVLKAGAVYLPLDVRHPWERSLEILAASGAQLVLTTAAQHAALVERCPVGVVSIDGVRGEREANLELLVHPAQLAYVIYTSGSTGVPKGAMVTMAGMLNNQLSKVPYFGLGDSDVIAQTAAPSFDISVWQLLAALLCGARVEIVRDEVAGDPVALLRHVQATGVTVLESVPSLMLGMMSEPAIALPGLRWMLPTGEALTPELARLWLARYPAIPLVNAYGPAECADDVALCRIAEPPGADEVRMPIGRPTDNTRLYVLDAALAPVPVGVIGELCVAGVGVGRGYLADPARTAGVFVPDPFGAPGARLYRTGDRARQRRDGTLEYVGRADHQVKLRGHRIELGEIEARLDADAAVRVATVVLREDVAGQPRLVAYVVPSAPAEPADLRGRLRERLAAALPGYMVPSQIVVLDELPTNANGKVNRRALPAPDLAEAASDYVAPRTELERRLAAIWADVLGVPRVGIADHFFALGGHSLLIMRVASRIKHELGHELAMRALFEAPTVAALAALIEGAAASAPTRAEVGIMAELLDELEDRT